MIGARETHDQFAAGVKPGQPDCGHHRLGAAHVERNFIEFRDRFEDSYVVGDDGMEGTQHRAELLHPVKPSLHPFLVTVESGHVESVGTAYVESPMTIKVPKLGSGGGRNYRTDTEVFAHELREGKRDAICVGEAQIGKALADAVTPRDGLCVVGLKEAGQAGDGLPANLRPRLVGPVGAKKFCRRVVGGPEPQRQ